MKFRWNAIARIFLCNGKNLAVKAAKAFFHATHLDGGVKITLQKRIPHGAGMGEEVPMRRLC